MYQFNAGACFDIFFALVYKEGNYGVAGDVNAGTRHIKDTVDTGYNGRYRR